MEIKLTRPVVFFDLETTGTSITHDRIVELSYIKVYPDGKEDSETIRVNPGCHIPAEATAVHHITDADVADAPRFAEIAPRVAQILPVPILPDTTVIVSMCLCLWKSA